MSRILWILWVLLWLGFFSAQERVAMSDDVIPRGNPLPNSLRGPELCALAAAGNLQGIRRLVGEGVSPDSTDQRLRPAIFYALRAKNPVPVVALLVELGAKTEFDGGLTPIDDRDRKKLAAVLKKIKK